MDTSAIPSEALKYDCSGLAASPGFIDIHSHSDGGILLHPEAECIIRQGITTSIGGNCGGSAGGTSFWTEKNREKYQSIGIRWEDFEGFLRAVDKTKPAVNLGMLFGHGDVRTELLGNFWQTPHSSREGKGDRNFPQAYAGRCIWRFGRAEYVPGRFADADELVTVSRAVTERDGIHSMHMRNEPRTHGIC